jgi:putative membrane protein
MMQVLAMLYLWLKAGHVIFVVFWMAGLFMLPRFFIYHQELPEESPQNADWIEREARLLKIILRPSLVLVWAFGLVLAVSGGWFTQGWLHVKLLFVVVLSAYHMWMANYARHLAAGRRKLTGKQLRLLNEVPGVAAAIIIVLVILKPF